MADDEVVPQVPVDPTAGSAETQRARQLRDHFEQLELPVDQPSAPTAPAQ